MPPRPMTLKRGVERKSCDFCYGRKRKCDREERAAQGFDTCSPCGLRAKRCRVEDSDDTPVQQPRGMEASGGYDPVPAEHISVPVVETGQSALSQYPQDFFFDDDFSLSADTVLFLDHVFMGKSLSTEGADGTSTVNGGHPAPDSSFELIENGPAARTEFGRISPQLNDETGLINIALRAYFDYAASYLPVLFADAFWADFHAGRSSPSLLYAVACRGIPFTEAPNKWQVQQQFSQTFRQNFLETRSAALDNAPASLDDLEALALMIDFQYDDADSPPLHANLGRLFLTHESLVSLTLRSQTSGGQSNRASGVESTTPLARASERRTLLYWHVYGLDAFHCLDRRQLSAIPDLDAAGSDGTPANEAKDYWDAILSLAVIARKITQAMCTTSAKRQGIYPDDVRRMYEHLAHWRVHSCPPHLRRHITSSGTGSHLLVASAPVPNDGDNNKPPHQHHHHQQEPNTSRHPHLNLRRAVLWALEINCTMQIEACVAAHRLRADSDTHPSLDTELAALQVELESVRALDEMRMVGEWMMRMRGVDGGGGSSDNQQPRHSLVDLASNVLRNACAGMCFWACQRGVDICERRAGGRDQGAVGGYMHACQREGKDSNVKVYRETAKLLRDCVATAVSHQDTARVVEGLDGRLALLDAALDRV